MTSIELSTRNLKKDAVYKSLFYFLNGNNYFDNQEQIYKITSPNSILGNFCSLLRLDEKLFRKFDYQNNQEDVDRFVGNLIIESSNQPSPIVMLTNALTNKKIFEENVIQSPFTPKPPKEELLKQLANRPFEEQVEIIGAYIMNTFSKEILQIYGRSKGNELLPEYLRRLSRILFLPIPDNLSLNDLRNPYDGSNYQKLFPELFNIQLKDINGLSEVKKEDELKKSKKYKNLKTKYSYQINKIGLEIDIENNTVDVIQPKKKQIKIFKNKDHSKIKDDKYQAQVKKSNEAIQILRNAIFLLLPESKDLPWLEETLKFFSYCQCLLPFSPQDALNVLHNGTIEERKKMVSTLVNGWTDTINGHKIEFPGLTNISDQALRITAANQEIFIDRTVLIFPFVKIDGKSISWRDYLEKHESYPSNTVKQIKHKQILGLPSITYDTAWDKNRDLSDVSEQVPASGWAALVIQNDYNGEYDGRTMLPEYCLSAFSLGTLLSPKGRDEKIKIPKDDSIIFYSDSIFHDLRLKTYAADDIYLSHYTNDHNYQRHRESKKSREKDYKTNTIKHFHEKIPDGLFGFVVNLNEK